MPRSQRNTTICPAPSCSTPIASRQGYDINMFCMSLMKAENRTAFKANEAAYLNRCSADARSRSEAILKRDWNGMLSSAATSISPPSSPRPTGSRSSRSPR